jgi:predicted nuclease of predicted toxin-antitoxin system
VTLLLDVHLPRRLADFFKAKGHDAQHTLDILSGDRTKDTDLRQYADLHGYVIVTKDKDFVTSHTFLRSPRKLIKINLGNLGNEELINIFEKSWKSISAIVDTSEFMVEMDRVGIVLHEPRG